MWSALPAVLCPGDLQALLWVEVGVAATAAGQPGPDGRCRPTRCALLADLGIADLGAARREESQSQSEERWGERVGWSRCLTTCLALDSFPDPGLAVVVLEHLLMATWPSVIFETLSK